MYYARGVNCCAQVLSILGCASAADCRGVSGANCGDLAAAFASSPVLPDYPDGLADWSCNAFPDDASPRDTIVVALISLALALPVTAFAGACFEIANDAGAAESWLSWGGWPRLLLGGRAHRRWHYTGAAGQPSRFVKWWCRSSEAPALEILIAAAQRLAATLTCAKPPWVLEAEEAEAEAAREAKEETDDDDGARSDGDGASGVEATRAGKLAVVAVAAAGVQAAPRTRVAPPVPPPPPPPPLPLPLSPPPPRGRDADCRAFFMTPYMPLDAASATGAPFTATASSTGGGSRPTSPNSNSGQRATSLAVFPPKPAAAPAQWPPLPRGSMLLQGRSLPPLSLSPPRAHTLRTMALGYPSASLRPTSPRIPELMLSASEEALPARAQDAGAAGAAAGMLHGGVPAATRGAAGWRAATTRLAHVSAAHGERAVGGADAGAAEAAGAVVLLLPWPGDLRRPSSRSVARGSGGLLAGSGADRLLAGHPHAATQQRSLGNAVGAASGKSVECSDGDEEGEEEEEEDEAAEDEKERRRLTVVGLSGILLIWVVFAWCAPMSRFYFAAKAQRHMRVTHAGGRADVPPRATHRPARPRASTGSFSRTACSSTSCWALTRRLRLRARGVCRTRLARRASGRTW
jgi:hypothetical protein